MDKSKRRVLVVDDDPGLRSLATAILSGEFEVLEAEDGLDGWEKARSWRPDLVITDIMMPLMHGYELCARLKGPEGIKGVKIIVASSKPFATDKSQAIVAGADAYIVKPFNTDDLLNRTRDLLAGGTTARSLPAPAPHLPGPAARPSVPASLPGPAELLPVYVKFWGTRGSCPTSGTNTVRYGGNTSCTEIRIGDTPLIIDCGSGMRDLGDALTREFTGRPVKGYIFVGHTHWDHIQGFPFFTPLYNPRNTFTVYSVRGAHSGLRNIFSDSMALDYFPIPLSSLASRLDFVELEGAVDIGAAKISFHHLNHPGVCIGFRIEVQEKVITYLSDHEGFVKLGGDGDMARRQDAEVAGFARGSDLLILEAQYTEKEYASRKGWGHGTYDDAVRFAADTGAKRLAIFHHDPGHTDEIMDENIKYCRELLWRDGAETDCFAARDGLRVDL